MTKAFSVLAMVVMLSLPAMAARVQIGVHLGVPVYMDTQAIVYDDEGDCYTVEEFVGDNYFILEINPSLNRYRVIERGNARLNYMVENSGTSWVDYRSEPIVNRCAGILHRDFYHGKNTVRVNHSRRGR